MSNRVEDLENQVAELQATIDGLTEELVETKERVRELEAQADEFEELAASEGAGEEAAQRGQTTAEQQAEAGGTDERRDASIVEGQAATGAAAQAETETAAQAEPEATAGAPVDAEAEEPDDDDDDDEIIVA